MKIDFKDILLILELVVGILTLFMLFESYQVQNQSLQIQNQSLQQSFQSQIVRIDDVTCPSSITDNRYDAYGLNRTITISLRNVGRGSADAGVYPQGVGFIFWPKSKAYVIAPDDTIAYPFTYQLNVSKDAAPPEVQFQFIAACKGNCNSADFTVILCKYARNESLETQSSHYYQLVEN